MPKMISGVCVVCMYVCMYVCVCEWSVVANSHDNMAHMKRQRTNAHDGWMQVNTPRPTSRACSICAPCLLSKLRRNLSSSGIARLACNNLFVSVSVCCEVGSSVALASMCVCVCVCVCVCLWMDGCMYV